MYNIQYIIYMYKYISNYNSILVFNEYLYVIPIN